MDYRRLDRALTERIYVEERQIAPDPAHANVDMAMLKVMGSSYKSYWVTVAMGGCSCTCYDWTMRGREVGYCKHILNVLVKVLKVPVRDVHYDQINYEFVLSDLRKLHRVDLDRDPEGLGSDPKNIRDDTECSVCYEPFVQGSDTFRAKECPHCSHLFHADCFERWLQRKPSCPLCRGRIVSSKRKPSLPDVPEWSIEAP